MAYDEQSGVCADTEKEEPVFFIGMIRVVYEQGLLVRKDRLAFLERYAMLTFVDAVLGFIPYESQQTHADNEVML